MNASTNTNSSITLSMIVKNEERYLAECLESVKGVVDEIILVDTGSEDRTIEIAKSYNASIYNFEWTGSFSEARNYALSKSNSNWVLYLDADERLEKESIEEIKKIIKSEEELGVRCQIINIDDYGKKPKLMQYIRFFKNSENCVFNGRVHEQIETSLKEADYRIVNSNIKITHIGYNLPKEGLQEKAKRNLTPLLKDFNELKDGYSAYQLGNTYSILEDEINSVKYFKLASEVTSLSNEYKAICFLHLSNYEFNNHNNEASHNYLNKGLECDSENVLLNMLASQQYFRVKDANKAFSYCDKAIELNDKLESGSKREVDIQIDSIRIIIHGIYLAIESQNIKKENYYLEQLKNLNTHPAKNWFTITSSIKKGKQLNKTDNEYLVQNISQEYINGITALITKYSTGNVKLELLKSISLNHLSSYIMVKLGLTLMEQGKINEAIQIFETSLELKDKDPSAVFYLISLYLNSNNFDKISNLLVFAETEFSHIKEFEEKFRIALQKLSPLIN